MGIQLLVDQYLEAGGTITKAPEGVAKDALKCDSTYAVLTRNWMEPNMIELANLRSGTPRLFKSPEEIAKENKDAD
jgi:hypothetical protein